MEFFRDNFSSSEVRRSWVLGVIEFGCRQECSGSGSTVWWLDGVHSGSTAVVVIRRCLLVAWWRLRGWSDTRRWGRLGEVICFTEVFVLLLPYMSNLLLNLSLPSFATLPSRLRCIGVVPCSEQLWDLRCDGSSVVLLA